MGALTKLEIARRLLGTALALYLEDKDPISVHMLTGGGGELAEQLARSVGTAPFIEHVLRTKPEMTERRYYELARQYYNAFKHYTTRSGRSRHDQDLLAAFRDQDNDALLFIAWTDYLKAEGALPIEAQVFLVWFYAMHPEKMARRSDGERFVGVFPALSSLSRAEQKAALSDEIVHARLDRTVMDDPRTDRRPLILGDWYT